MTACSANRERGRGGGMALCVLRASNRQSRRWLRRTPAPLLRKHGDSYFAVYTKGIRTYSW